MGRELSLRALLYVFSHGELCFASIGTDTHSPRRHACAHRATARVQVCTSTGEVNEQGRVGSHEAVGRVAGSAAAADLAAAGAAAAAGWRALPPRAQRMNEHVRGTIVCTFGVGIRNRVAPHQLSSHGGLMTA